MLHMGKGFRVVKTGQPVSWAPPAHYFRWLLAFFPSLRAAGMQPSGAAVHSVGLIIPLGCSASHTWCSISLSFVRLAFSMLSALKWLLGSAAFCLGKQKEECEKNWVNTLGCALLKLCLCCLAKRDGTIIPFAALCLKSGSMMLTNVLTWLLVNYLQPANKELLMNKGRNGER